MIFNLYASLQEIIQELNGIGIEIIRIKKQGQRIQFEYREYERKQRLFAQQDRIKYESCYKVKLQQKIQQEIGIIKMKEKDRNIVQKAQFERQEKLRLQQLYEAQLFQMEQRDPRFKNIAKRRINFNKRQYRQKKKKKIQE